MRVIERYASAVHATSLKSDPETYMSDTDVLGAMGLAAKQHPLGAALTRLLEGGGSGDAIVILSAMVFKRARTERVKLKYVEAMDIAKSVIAWHRNGTCRTCQGRGYIQIFGAPVNGDECPICHGGGKMPLESNFDTRVRALAHWASSEIDYRISSAAHEAMCSIAPRFDL